MFRRRTNAPNRSDISVGAGDDVDDKLYRKTSKRSIAPFYSSPSTQTVQISYIIIWTTLLVRSYVNGITAAGNETWYPVPLIGFVRSELALVCFVAGSIPFLFIALGWTNIGIISLAGVAVGISQLVMPGPIPIPFQAYRCYAIITGFLVMIVVPFRKKPQAALVIFLSISIAMPNLPEVTKPLFSSVQVEDIPYHVINLAPDIIEEVGAAALESGPLLEFVWENRNDWVKVSHGRALGYFVFG